MPVPFRVLFVCTGNICRSPLGERLLRARLAERLGADAALVEVDSAGVHGLVGEPMDPLAAAVLTSLGGDPEGFEGRRLDADLVRRADLVLAASRKHRATIARLDPTSVRKTFTIPELARLAGTVDPAHLPDADAHTRLAAAVEEAATNRGTVRADERADDDVRDPYGGPDSLHREVGAQIAAALEPITELIVRAVDPEAAATTTPTEAAHTGTEPAQPQARTESSQAKADRVPLVALPRRWWLLPAGLAVVLLLAGGWLAYTGLGAQRELEAARPQVADIKRAVLAGDSARAERQMASLQRHTAAARSKTDGPVWALAAHLPVIGNDVDAVRTVASAVDEVARDVLPPLVKVGDAASPANLRVAGDRIKLTPLIAAGPQLQAASTRSAQIDGRVAGLDAAGLASPVAGAVTDVRKQLDELVSLTGTGAKAAELLPPMLGAEGPRRYFLAFQNNAEARGTGGLLGAYGILEADHGRIRLRELGSNSQLKSPTSMPVDLGPDFNQLYGEDAALWVNANLSPHFPYAARIWLANWQRQHHERLDGVIATDPVAMGYILKATGPARLPDGEQVTADNAVSLTLSKVYERYPRFDQNKVRDAFLQQVAGAVFAKVLSGQGDARALAEQLGKAAGERRLLVYSSVPAEEKRLGETSLAGALPDDDKPFLGVVVNTGVAGKLDYYLDRTVAYTQTACTSRGRNTRVTVTLTNTAPRSGLPDYVAPHEHGVPGEPVGTDLDLVNVFTTRGSQLVHATLDGSPAAARLGAERGHPVFGFDVTLRPGQRRTIVLDLEEPATGTRPTMLRQPLVTPLDATNRLKGC